jgi:hypothetical protein
MAVTVAVTVAVFVMVMVVIIVMTARVHVILLSVNKRHFPPEFLATHLLGVVCMWSMAMAMILPVPMPVAVPMVVMMASRRPHAEKVDAQANARYQQQLLSLHFRRV